MNRLLIGFLCIYLLLLVMGCSDSSKGTGSTNVGKRDKIVQVKSDTMKTGMETTNVKAKDIAGHPCEKEIKELLKTGAVQLDNRGKFNPDEMITRGEFISWIYKVNSKGVKPIQDSKASYSDLSSDDEYFAIVEGLTVAGLVKGYPDGTIKLDKELTRQEAAYIWGVYVQQPIVVNLANKAPYEQLIWSYGDKGDVLPEYLRSVGVFRQQWKQVFGDLPRLMPNESVTRAEAAQWIILCREAS